MLHISDGTVDWQHQFPKTLLWIKRSTHDQNVSHQVHQSFQLGMGAIGNGGAHRQIMLTTVAAKQQDEGTEHDAVECVSPCTGMGDVCRVSCGARAATVGYWNSRATGASADNSLLICWHNRMASSESPPRWKKWIVDKVVSG